MLGATIQHHLDLQPEEVEDTVQTLKDNTYVDNIMQIGSDVSELEKFKVEATEILEGAKLPLHKWESNVESLESEDMPNPSKILGLAWDKKEDELYISAPEYPEGAKVTKKSIVSHLGKVYDPLGIVSPTMAEGKRIYREACDETKSWDAEISKPLEQGWLRWTRQLRTVKIPRSITKGIRKIKQVHLHIFADASNLACSCATIAVVEHSTETVKGLLTAKARISKRNTSIPRLELIGGQMAANMATNVCKALKQLPIASITIWMDSTVALFWILNPARSWKTFVANRVRKIASITSELDIKWKYCPSKENVADLGSRGASINRME
ncbi:Pro-Pol poly, partial [Paramuricea clavata]